MSSTYNHPAAVSGKARWIVQVGITSPYRLRAMNRPVGKHRLGSPNGENRAFFARYLWVKGVQAAVVRLRSHAASCVQAFYEKARLFGDCRGRNTADGIPDSAVIHI